jgi:hypothetical protein
MAIAHAEGTITVLDLSAEVPGPCDPEASVAVFATILTRYRLSECVGDAYSGEWCRSSFARHGIDYLHSEKNKNELYLDFLPQITSRQTQLLDDQRIVAQLTSLERRCGRNADVIDHPQRAGFHDDVSNVVAGSLCLCASTDQLYGLLGWAQGVVSGIYQNPLNAPLEQRSQERNRQWEAERKARKLEPRPINPCTQGAWKDEDAPPCIDADCRRNIQKCTIFISGGGPGVRRCRCQQCGLEWWKDGKAPLVTYAARDGGYIQRPAP